MKILDSRVELCCPFCGVSLRVRHTDPYYPALNVIWELVAKETPKRRHRPLAAFRRRSGDH